MSKTNPNKNQIKRKPSLTKVVLGSHCSREDYDTGNKLWLYRFVYSTRFSLSVVILLLFSFTLQSTERVFANENIPPDSIELTEESVLDLEVVEEIVSEPIETNESDVFTTLDSDSEAIDNVEEINLTSNSEILESAEVLPELDSTSSIFSSTTQETVLSDTGVNSPDETDINETEESISEDYSEETEINEPLTDEADSTNEDADYLAVDEDIVETSTSTDDFEEEISSTTASELIDELLIEQQTTFETVSVTESDSEFSFNKDECTQLATGSFYCRQPKPNILNDALFSAPDEDGDLEIFLIRDGVQVQVTNNSVDDAAPYYDKNSNTLVWHRLINDRYQIISYDPDKQKEEQITYTSDNNMEPTRQGEYTVWQRWVDEGWNIILLDGEEERQITKDNNHNVAPYIHGTLVVWNSRNSSGEKTIEMYDIISNTYVTVEDPDGLSVSNPRMVFVYDSLHPNGDIVTKGYDVLAKKFIDLDTLPRDLPEELPPADSTGETRALIQSKPNIKSEVEESISSSTPTIIPPFPLDTPTTTEQMTLDLSNSTSTEDVEVDDTLTQTEFDIVIEPFVIETTTTTDSVQD